MTGFRVVKVVMRRGERVRKRKKKKVTSGGKRLSYEIKGITINLPPVDLTIHGIQPEEAKNRLPKK